MNEPSINKPQSLGYLVIQSCLPQPQYQLRQHHHCMSHSVSSLCRTRLEISLVDSTPSFLPEHKTTSHIDFIYCCLFAMVCTYHASKTKHGYLSSHFYCVFFDNVFACQLRHSAHKNNWFVPVKSPYIKMEKLDLSASR